MDHEWISEEVFPTNIQHETPPMFHLDLFFVGAFLRIGIPWDSPLNSPPFGGEYMLF